MKNIQHLFNRSNLTPLERVTLLVHNDEHRAKTGKGILHPLDLNAIKDGWKGTTPEIKEYNRYIGIAQLEHSMRMDARMFSYHAELSLLRHQRLLSHTLSDSKQITEMRNDVLMKNITDEESIDFATAHTYLDYRDTLHTFTLYNLTLEVREDLVLLDDSVTHSREYLGDEVFLYEMFKDGKLNKKDKDTLINTIFSRLYYEGIKKLRNGTEKDGYLTGGYFASLPLEEVIHEVAHDIGITWKDKEEEDLLDDIEAYAKKKQVTMEDLTREALHQWLDNGLFAEQFTPMFASNHYNTWNGNTKKSHKELFTIWYTELEKSREYLAKLFSAGKLKRQDVEMIILRETKTVEIITGESLYACMEDLAFVHQYKKQVETILPFSNLVLFIEKYAHPIRNRTTFSELKKLARQAANIFDANFTEGYEELIQSYKDELVFLNHELVKLTDMATEHLHANVKDEYQYNIHITDGKFWFDPEAEGDVADIVRQYGEEFGKVIVIK